MGAPFVIDSLTLTLGRFIHRQSREQAAPVASIEPDATDCEASAPTLITLSSGQMLLPGIASPHQFSQ